MQVYLDPDGKPHCFNPADGEAYPDPSLRIDPLIVRTDRGVWVEGNMDDAAPLGPSFEDESAPLWERFQYRWGKLSLARAAQWFPEFGLSIPLSLEKDILGRGQPDVPQASVSDSAAGTADLSTDPSTTPGTTPGTSGGAKGTTGTGERRRGQALLKQEEKEYRRIIRIAKRLNLPSRTVGNTVKIAEAAKVDTGVVTKVLKWGRKHGQY